MIGLWCSENTYIVDDQEWANAITKAAVRGGRSGIDSLRQSSYCRGGEFLAGHTGFEFPGQSVESALHLQIDRSTSKRVAMLVDIALLEDVIDTCSGIYQA